MERKECLSSTCLLLIQEESDGQAHNPLLWPYRLNESRLVFRQSLYHIGTPLTLPLFFRTLPYLIPHSDSL